MMPCIGKMCFANATLSGPTSRPTSRAAVSIALRCNGRVVVDTMHDVRPFSGEAAAMSRMRRSIQSGGQFSLPHLVRSEAKPEHAAPLGFAPPVADTGFQRAFPETIPRPAAARRCSCSAFIINL